MNSDPTETSLLETECLFGETVDVFEESSDWVYCKLKTDNYCGWVKKKSLGKLKKSTHRVILNRTFVYVEKNPKSICLFYLPMGAQLAIEDIKSGWAEVNLHNNKIKTGYIPSKHIVELNHRVKDWVSIAELFDETPYKWGGRNSIGIDCSALLQLSYQTYGENIPRNTSEQVKLNKRYVENINQLQRGCVVFWEGHVAIMVDNKNCIHANAFHMKTKIETLYQIMNRGGNNLNIIRMMDFN